MDMPLDLLKFVLYITVVIALAWAGYRFSRHLGRGHGIGLLVTVTIIGAAGGPVWWPYVFNPLPKDELMIAQFQAHRADFEALVKRYREFDPPPNGDASTLWNRPPEVKAMMRRAGVSNLESVGAVWMPSPYSIETAKRVEYLAHHPKEHGYSLVRRYGSIKVELIPEEQYQYVLIWRYGWFWKELLHLPEIPRLEGDRLLNPAHPEGLIEKGTRVFESLDGYPRNWQRGECVLRRIEPRWFIRMCTAAM